MKITDRWRASRLGRKMAEVMAGLWREKGSPDRSKKEGHIADGPEEKDAHWFWRQVAKHRRSEMRTNSGGTAGAAAVERGLESEGSGPASGAEALGLGDEAAEAAHALSTMSVAGGEATGNDGTDDTMPATEANPATPAAPAWNAPEGRQAIQEIVEHVLRQREEEDAVRSGAGMPSGGWLVGTGEGGLDMNSENGLGPEEAEELEIEARLRSLEQRLAMNRDGG
jgi:hypothetical protein